MISIYGLLALGALMSAICMHCVATVIKLIRLLWFMTGDKETRGELPRFTGLVLAMFFSSLAAPDILSVEPFLTLSYRNPVPPQHRVKFLIGMLVLALAAWISGSLLWSHSRRQPDC